MKDETFDNGLFNKTSTEVQQFIDNLKAQNKPLDLTRLCNDFLQDKITPIFFNLMIGSTWNKRVEVDYGKLPKPEYAHWAMWSASEPFTLFGLTEEEKKHEYNDVGRYKELIRLAMSDPIACFKAQGLLVDDLD